MKPDEVKGWEGQCLAGMVCQHIAADWDFTHQDLHMAEQDWATKTANTLI